MTSKLLTAAVLACAMLATACNTVRGAGRDVESVGETVQKTTN